MPGFLRRSMVDWSSASSSNLRIKPSGVSLGRIARMWFSIIPWMGTMGYLILKILRAWLASKSKCCSGLRVLVVL